MGLAASVIQTLRDDKTSDIRLKPKIKGIGPTEKRIRTLQGLIPFLMWSGV
jgi:hypothetical protein